MLSFYKGICRKKNLNAMFSEIRVCIKNYLFGLRMPRVCLTMGFKSKLGVLRLVFKSMIPLKLNWCKV